MSKKRSIWILGDQLSHEHPALATASKKSDRILMIEPGPSRRRRREHKLKLVLIYSTAPPPAHRPR